MDSLIDAVKLYDDFHYRQQVDRLDSEIAKLDTRRSKIYDLKKKREAIASNILEDLLKPKLWLKLIF